MKKDFLVTLSVSLLILLLAVFLYRGVAINRNKAKGNKTSNIPQATINQKTFQSSDVMDFSIEVSGNYEVVDKLTYVDLVSDNGKINISRSGSDFSSLEEYLFNFDNKRNLKVLQDQAFNINKHEARKRKEAFSEGLVKEQEVVYILVGDFVYSFSTNSEILYNDLDQIARTFEYTP